MIAQHPTSGVKIKILSDSHWLWCFLFGWLYYASKGMWGIAVISFVTINGLLIVFPIMNRKLVRNYHERNGWIIEDEKI